MSAISEQEGFESPTHRKDGGLVILEISDKHAHRIIELLESLERKLTQMAASVSDVDAALATLTATDTTLATEVSTLVDSANKVDADITALIAKVNAGQPVDLTAELAAIQAENAKNVSSTTNIQNAVTGLQASDAAANPPAAAPAS